MLIRRLTSSERLHVMLTTILINQDGNKLLEILNYSSSLANFQDMLMTISNIWWQTKKYAFLSAHTGDKIKASGNYFQETDFIYLFTV